VTNARTGARPAGGGEDAAEGIEPTPASGHTTTGDTAHGNTAQGNTALGVAVLDDGTLVARARDGDVRAFEMLVRRYQGRIYALALRMMGNGAEAQDIVQDVFLTAWRRLPELRADAAFVGWLYRTASNRCLAQLRRRKPVNELEPEGKATTDAREDPQRAAQVSGQLRALEGALATLTPQQRACWLLREAHGRSYDEIAELVDATPASVRGRIARARLELAKVMQPWR
jgi:RNA polymerase sigma-70 factor (ECF subfamily)